MTSESLLKSVESSGWHLSKEAVDEFLAENPNLNTNGLVQLALNSDLKNIGEKYLPIELVSGGKSNEFVAKNYILQLVKLRNIAAPKENEHSHTAPPMYRITLTDGHSNLNALILDDVKNLNLNTAPGTKLLLNGSIKLLSNMLILNNQNCKVLGGSVEHLVKKWIAAKELSHHVRAMNMTDTAPPPWVPFGFKQTNQVDTSKKVLAQTADQQEDTTSEFSQARKAALAEALEAKQKVTKTFTQQTIDKTQIIKEEPAQAKSTTSYIKPELPSESKQKPKGRKGKGRKGRFDDSDDESAYRDVKDKAKPSEVTLFDLFKTKLELDEKPATPIESTQNVMSTSTNGPRGSRMSYRNQAHQQQQQPQSKQTYNQNDFNFDLNSDINPKDLKSSSAAAAFSAINSNANSTNTINQNQRVNNDNFNQRRDNRNQKQSQQRPSNNNYNQSNRNNDGNRYQNENRGDQPRQIYSNNNFNNQPRDNRGPIRGPNQAQHQYQQPNDNFYQQAINPINEPPAYQNAYYNNNYQNQRRNQPYYNNNNNYNDYPDQYETQPQQEYQNSRQRPNNYYNSNRNYPNNSNNYNNRNNYRNNY